MILLRETGSNTVFFRSDKINTALITTSHIFFSLTSDSSREFTAVKFYGSSIQDQGNYTNATFVFDSTGSSSTGSLGYIKPLKRGFYEYKIYYRAANTEEPYTAEEFTTANGYSILDIGKALIVTNNQYNAITGKTTTNAIDVRDSKTLNGEVFYNKHTDKVQSSQIDVDNNFLYIN